MQGESIPHAADASRYLWQPEQVLDELEALLLQGEHKGRGLVLVKSIDVQAGVGPVHAEHSDRRLEQVEVATNGQLVNKRA